MDTTTSRSIEKKAAVSIAGIAKTLGLNHLISPESVKGLIGLAVALGALGGAGAGTVSSYVKEKNPELLALRRQKKFYDRKTSEMENENWLNDIITLKKKLDTGKLSTDERASIEQQYTDLLNK